MKPANGSPRLYLASSGTGKKPVVSSAMRLRSVMLRLEECKMLLSEPDDRDTAQLVAMAVLQLQMRIHHIGDAELRALCDAMTPGAEKAVSDSVSKASGDRGL
jgi:hypothetical protein